MELSNVVVNCHTVSVCSGIDKNLHSPLGRADFRKAVVCCQLFSDQSRDILLHAENVVICDIRYSGISAYQYVRTSFV